MSKLIKMLKDKKGQGLVEYALIIVLVSIVVVAALLLMGPQISATFNTITACLTAPSAAACAV